TYRNDVPLSWETGILEATHLSELYLVYADQHNDHLSPYSDSHPDPLERCVHEYPDIESVTWEDHEPHWYIGITLSHALNNAYRRARQVFGDALQPEGWDRLEPWRTYNFEAELATLRMPNIPQPIAFHEGAYHFPFNSRIELQRIVHLNNFYAMCLYAYAIIINAA
ncbi:unnamed protein product, partial [Rhizoctonia solani]